MGAAAETARDQEAAYLLWSVYKPNQIARRFYSGIGGKFVDDLDFMTIPV
jgi:hypothetical protein